jgi:hypothetical protein
MYARGIASLESNEAEFNVGQASADGDGSDEAGSEVQWVPLEVAWPFNPGHQLFHLTGMQSNAAYL